jgi:DNA ligase (NAD+)
MADNLKAVRERVERLRKLIQYHRTLYHTFDAPEISEAALDSLKNELQQLEYQYPDLISSGSPTQTIGAEPLKEFIKVQRSIPMLSFNDAFSEKEMGEWLGRLENYLGKSIIPEFYCELKIDGLAIELVYKKGILVQGSTRGDGRTGEDITQNIKTIASIPQELEKLGQWEIPELVVVRGEVFMSKKEFARVNQELKKRGEKPYANTRNLAAGSLRQLDPKITASRKLESFQYDIVQGIPKNIKTHEQKHKVLASWGLTVNEHNKKQDSLEKVFKFRNLWETKRETLDYEIDGIVVIANDLSVFEAGGVIGKAPRGAIAYKFSPKEATTILENIIVQVGRTGVLTPVAVLKPVELMGVTITSATLHNFDQIKKLDIRVGDTIVVSRAGDVIPQITQTFPELRAKDSRPYQPPSQCPVDNSPIINEGVVYRCSNKQCAAQQRRQLYHFVSRGAFNIEGLGYKIIDRFISEGLIKDAADIFSLRKEQIAALDRFGEKSADNLIAEIREKKQISLSKFLYALGILHVGEETAQLLSAKVIEPSICSFSEGGQRIRINNLIDVFQELSLEILQQIPDIGPKVSQSIYDWFHHAQNIALLEKLEKNGVRIIGDKRQGTSGNLKNKTFVFTGELKTLTRDEAKQRVRAFGGDVSETVSKKTNYVVAGEDPGSKFAKAKALGVRILDEPDFLKLIGK